VVNPPRIGREDYGDVAFDEHGVEVTPTQGETATRLVYPPSVEVLTNSSGITNRRLRLNLQPTSEEQVTFDCIFGWYSWEEGFENRQTDPRLAP